MSDEINVMMVRCAAARQRYEAEDSHVEEFRILWLGPREWWVGFYTDQHGKVQAPGPTLTSALSSWLEMFEH